MDEHAQAMKKGGAARMFLADLLWLVVFFSVWGGLIAFWNTWWALLLVPVFAVMMAGFSEIMHQGAHTNLCGRVRWLNELVGTLAGAAVNIDMRAYRDFHLKHHKLVNTEDDPERELYALFAAKSAGWKARSFAGKVVALFGLLFVHLMTMFFGFNSSKWYVLTMRFAIPLAIAGIGYLEGLPYPLIALKVAVCWILPFLLFIVVDFFMTQSEHHGTESKPRPSGDLVPYPEQYQISWNLAAPWPFGFMVFGRNMHAEHHDYPAIHWWYVRDKKTGRTLPLFTYLRKWWTEGPRVMT